jgi:excisionase family DNA binding protein
VKICEALRRCRGPANFLAGTHLKATTRLLSSSLIKPFSVNNLQRHPPPPRAMAPAVPLWMSGSPRMAFTETAPENGFELRIGRSLSLDHAAQILGVSRRTIYNRIREGLLQTIRTPGGSQRVLVNSMHKIPGEPPSVSHRTDALMPQPLT